MSTRQEFQPTSDELKAIGEAMKNEEFRKLLAEYADEISNPENKQRYEDEIRQMEAMQGNDVKFINPEPGWVLKTYLANAAKTKVFINICQSNTLEKPQSKRVTRDGKTGMNWAIPHSIAASRDDVDKEGKMCVVYDAVFHPDALRLGKSNDGFKQLLATSAMDSIERQFPQHKLDRTNLKYPKMKFKGTPAKTIIRNAADGKQPKARDEVVKSFQQSLQQTTKSAGQTKTQLTNSKTEKNSRDDDSWRDIPFKVVYQTAFDMASTLPQQQQAGRPEGVTVTFDLPECKSAAGLDLDVTERSVRLQHAQLRLKVDVALSYPVVEDKGQAKFDKKKRQLKLTLPIAPEPIAAPAPTPSNERPLVEVLPVCPDETAVPANAEALHASVSDQRHDADAVSYREPLSATVDQPFVPAAETQETTENVAPLVGVKCTQEDARLVVNIQGLVDSLTPVAALHTETFGPVQVHGVDIACSCGIYRLRFDAQLDESTLKLDSNSDNTIVTFIKSPAVPWHRIRHGWQGEALKEVTMLTATTLQSQLAAISDPYVTETAAAVPKTSSASGTPAMQPCKQPLKDESEKSGSVNAVTSSLDGNAVANETPDQARPVKAAAPADKIQMDTTASASEQSRTATLPSVTETSDTKEKRVQFSTPAAAPEAERLDHKPNAASAIANASRSTQSLLFDLDD
eukprot:TRINITY_DN11648_c0_g1_i2.p1 TRINITY_DN11648_c0_g1~~TRINITY_DN11648_c0_g1_i2.p1  ORF type:complete len:685 (+),score=173.69 TRINITY_DN11648_c0_g1_i2:141-2195(+)